MPGTSLLLILVAIAAFWIIICRRPHARGHCRHATHLAGTRTLRCDRGVDRGLVPPTACADCELHEEAD